MPDFTTAADGTPLAYERHGEGPAIMMVHGFGSSRLQNWKSTGWFGGLTEAGFSLVAMDCRGHGDAERDGLARPGLCRNKQIARLRFGSHHRGLNRGRLDIALFGESCTNQRGK